MSREAFTIKPENKQKESISKLDDIIKQDTEKVIAIALIEDDKKQKERIRAYIDEAISNFRSSQKTPQDFRNMINHLCILRHYDFSSHLKQFNKQKRQEYKNRYAFNLSRSWNQNQVNTILREMESQEAKTSQDSYFVFDAKTLSLFTTPKSKSKDEESISNLTAKYFISRLQEAKKLPIKMNKFLKMWSQNIHMVSPSIRLDLCVTILNNTAKVYNDTIYSIISGQSFYGPIMVSQLEELFNQNKNNTNKTIKIITILKYLSDLGDQVGFEAAGESARKLLLKIEKENDNYFIKVKISQLLGQSFAYVDIAAKRKFLKKKWQNLIHSNYFYNVIARILNISTQEDAHQLDPEDQSMILDDEIEQIFDYYRKTSKEDLLSGIYGLL